MTSSLRGLRERTNPLDLLRHNRTSNLPKPRGTRMSAATEQQSSMGDNGRWYAGVTRSMWLVLAVASAGWIFDVYEGQIFNITSAEMLSSILGVARDAPEVKLWGDRLLGV